MKVWTLVLAAAVGLPAAVDAQTAAPALIGTWQAKLDEGVHTVVIRADSSASYGSEVVRWRARGDSIFIALGGEWVAYRMKVSAKQLTLSGGDLPEPITLRRTGAAGARPANVQVPPDPDRAR